MEGPYEVDNNYNNNYCFVVFNWKWVRNRNLSQPKAHLIPNK